MRSSRNGFAPRLQVVWSGEEVSMDMPADLRGKRRLMLVELARFELATSSVRGKRSPN